jgi:beta-lactamase class A
MLVGAAALGASLVAGPGLAADAQARLKRIEARAGGRLGVFARRGETIVGWRADERFLMCSTFKALAVADVLARVDRGAEHLDRQIAYGPKDLVGYAPTTRANLAKGAMSLDGLCAAAIELSDNGAANLILASFGGPAGLTGYIRGLGDRVTRLDNIEPALNDPGPPGDTRNTTTPAAMAALWSTILLGQALSTASRERLADWLRRCQTGPNRLASITPAGWTIGHKTGTGSTTIGDLAILTPPGQQPILIAAYFEGQDQVDHPNEAAIADAGKVVLSLLAPGSAHG